MALYPSPFGYVDLPDPSDRRPARSGDGVRVRRIAVRRPGA